MTGIAQILRDSGSDKGTTHTYAELYDELFTPDRDRVRAVLEVGVWHGHNIVAWHKCFPRAAIYGVDRSKALEVWPTDRATYIDADCALPARLVQACTPFAPFDIIIDDGGHDPLVQVATFATLSPLLRPAGLYVIEDIQTIGHALHCARAFGGQVIDRRGIAGRYDDILLLWRAPGIAPVLSTTPPRLTLAVATHTEAMYAHLFQSVKDEDGIDITPVCGPAAAGFNAAITRARSDMVVCVRDGIVFHDRWLPILLSLAATCPQPWGVLGPAGTARGGQMYGTHSGLSMPPGHQHEHVQTLDSSCLVLHKANGLHFDEAYDHLYGEDVCLEAAARGLGCYAINLPVDRHAAPLPGGTGADVARLKAKWKPYVPAIYTTAGTY